MKRLFLAALTFTVAAAAVFAEINFSGNGSATIVPFGVRFGDPAETVTSSEVRWGDDGPRVQLVANGQNEAGTIGAVVALNADGHGLAIDDNAKVWLKPSSVFKVTLGKFIEDDLRFKIGVSGGGFHNYLLYIRGDNLDESAFFSRFKTTGFGTHVAFTPGNLYIGAAIGSDFDKRSVKELREDGALDAWANIQAGIGYKIDNVGFVRALFNGPKPTNEDGSDVEGFKATGAEATGRSPTFQVGFQLTAVKGLNIDLAGQIPLPYEYKQYSTPEVVIANLTEQRPYIIGLGFDTTLPTIPLRFYGRLSGKLGAYDETTLTDDYYTRINDPTVEKTVKVKKGDNVLFSFTPMYTVSPGWIIGLEYMLDVQFGSDVAARSSTGAVGGDVDKQYLEYWAEKTKNGGDDAKKAAELKNNYIDNGIGLFVRHNFAGGDVRFGATVKLPGGEAHEGAKPQLFFPIILNYNF